MKSKNILTNIVVGISLLAAPVVADVPPSKLTWPTGAEAIIDQAIAIKVEAQKTSLLMETEGWAAGHSFAKCMDDLALALVKSPEIRTTLEKEEGNDLKAKIALWALDRQARAEEYARIEHVHITDNPLGEAAEKRRVEALRPVPPLPGVTIVKTPSRFKPPPPVADEDAVEQNRLLLEYFYFAPPRGPGRWNAGFSRDRFGGALQKIRDEKSLVMLEFDLQAQIKAFPDIKPSDPDAGCIGGEIWRVLNFRTVRAFRIAASMIQHPLLRAHLELHFQSYQGWIYDAERMRLKSELEAMRRLAEMEWETDAEKELAGWIKAIPPIPEKPKR